MAGTRGPTVAYNDSTTAMNLPSSPFPFSSFLSDSLFNLDSTTSLPPRHAPPPPVPHQAGLFVHSKEINPFERSFAVVDPTSIPDSNPFARGAVHGGNAIGVSDLHLPTQRARRKRALSSPALFTPGGTGEAIDDGTAQAFKQAKRPSLRLGIDEHGLPPIPGLARGLVDSSSSIALSDSTGSTRSNTSISFDDDPNFRPKVAHGKSSTGSPDSSIGLSPELSKPVAQLRASSMDAFAPSSNSGPLQPNFAHYQPQPIPFAASSIAPTTVPFSGAARPFVSSTFATTTLAPASIPPPVSAPIPSGVALSSFNPSLSYAPDGDSSFAFSDPFALVPQPSSVYPTLAPSIPSIPPPHNAVVAVDLNAPLLAPPPPHFAHRPAVFDVSNPLTFAPPPPPPSIPYLSSETASVSTSSKGSAPSKPPGKKRGRKPKNWDPSLEVEVVLEPEEAERQRKLALERNRVAASKSRRRKKEKVSALEGAARNYCEGNQVLQSQCQALLAEVHRLRAYLIQSHPQPGCKCQHVHGYLNREREGGGLPAIMFEAQGSLDRDYSKVPKWGTEEDAYEGADGVHDQFGGSGNGGAFTGGGGPSKQKPGPKKGGKKQQLEPDNEGDEDEHDEDMSEEESEEEKVALKSRRARAIPLRKT
ncbi:hypothetical protein JCM11491_000187 [Sporobolomyces phaffii]